MDDRSAESTADPPRPSSAVEEKTPAPSSRAVLAYILLGAAAWRVFLFLSGRLPFDADQAQFGIGALRVLREGRHEIFIPGQNYAGDFWSYWFALLHLVMPASVAVMRLGMIPIVLIEISALYWAARRMFGDPRWALGAAAVMAFPPSAVMDLSMRSSVIMRAPLLAFLIAAGLLIPLIRRLQTATRRSDAEVTPTDLLTVLGASLALGWGYWGSPAGLMYVFVIGLAALAFPRAAFTLLGLVRAKETTAKPAARLAANLLQVLHVALLVRLVHWLFLGNAGPGVLPISQQGHPPVFLAGITLMVFLARLGLGFALGEGVRPRVLAIPMAGLGLQLGAAPVLWHQWVLDRAIMSPAARVETLGQAFQQFRSLIVTTIPILSGNLHNWGVEPAGLPSAVRTVLLATAIALLSGVVLAAVHARASRRPSAAGLTLVASMVIVQTVACALSSHGSLAAEPRYALSLYVMMALAAGGLLAFGGHLIWPGPQRSAVALAGLLALNGWSCLDMPRREIAGWSGEDRADRELLDYLTVARVDRVSCRFSDHDYWLAYKLVYIAGETIIFAPAFRGDRLYNRSERYQREVDEAPERAYLMLAGEESAVRKYLDQVGARYQLNSNRGYLWFTHVKPDVLADLSNRQELVKLMEH
ncbi:MAG: hypothetical protein N2111_05245 [Candidatus Sumerlaeaceae bacterium]|nr:hypothetical protein [Candidatus Sumerlaeaceae bacterium]